MKASKFDFVMLKILAILDLILFMIRGFLISNKLKYPKYEKQVEQAVFYSVSGDYSSGTSFTESTFM